MSIPIGEKPPDRAGAKSEKGSLPALGLDHRHDGTEIIEGQVLLGREDEVAGGVELGHRLDRLSDLESVESICDG